ncbi:MAG TPA: PAS domain S-box protein [Bacteroidota bacterium]|nr:PAS domain S-box protein [Bacteroidota bacterium]
MPLVAFGVLAVGIAAAAHFYFASLKDQIVLGKKSQLEALSELKVRQIVAWRKERLQDANYILHDKFIAHGVAELCSHPNNVPFRERTREWMTSMFKNQQFIAISLFDKKKRLLTSVQGKDHFDSTDDFPLFDEAALSNEILFSDFHKDNSNAVSLDIVIPFFEMHGSDSLLDSFVLLQIDPYHALYPLIQEWPSTSQTSEVFMVRREADSITFLSPLRHNRTAPLEFHLPLSNRHLVGVMAVTGTEGIVEGEDYGGVNVFAAVRKIPGTTWFLVAKSDFVEVLAPLQKDEWLINILVAALIASLGSVIVLIWKNQYTEFYKKMYEAELERKALAAHYEYLTKSVNDIFLLVDADDLRIIEANDRAVEAYGYTREELLQMTVRDLRPAEDMPEINEVTESLRTKSGIVFEANHRRKNGTIFPVEASIRTVEVGGKLFSQSTIRDISERKKTEEQLSLQSAALLSTANAIVITDTNGVVTWVNPAYTKMTGYSFEEVLGQNTRLLKSGKQDSLFYKNLWETIVSGGTWHGELVNKKKDGSLYDEEMTITPVKNRKGEITHFIAIKQDITDRKRLQEQLLQAQKMESVGTLAGGIAHDFNNILGIIIGYATVLERLGDDPEKFSESIAAINRAVQRGAGLVRQILTFARKSETSFQPLDVNVLVKELISMLYETFPKIITFSRTLEKDLPLIDADHTQLHQTVLNLCVNARDAMPNGGTLAIRTSKISGDSLRQQFAEARNIDYVCVSVADTGEGMDEELTKRIFEPFFTTKEKGRGTGLGLAVVHGVIHAHHGFINLESEIGKGTTFSLFFPVSSVERDQSSSGLTESEGPPGGVETILLVEDEELLLGIVKSLLERRGYKILTATNGYEAVSVYKEHASEIKLVLTDMGLPHLTGVEEFVRLKQINPDVKVILASGYVDQELKAEMLKTGLKAFVQKPYSPDEILEIVRKVLDSS